MLACFVIYSIFLIIFIIFIFPTMSLLADYLHYKIKHGVILSNRCANFHDLLKKCNIYR